jgi:hypothetical protein
MTLNHVKTLAATAAAAMAALATAKAQVVAVSNLNETPFGIVTTVGAVHDTYYAGRFTTGSDATQVTGAAAILRNGASSTLATYEASIWNAATTGPDLLPTTSLGVFDTNPTLAAEAGTHLITFSDAGISLAANTTYWLAIRNTSGNAIAWQITSSTAQDSPLGWTIADALTALKDPPIDWHNASGHSPMFSITVVPEPHEYALLAGLGLVGFAGFRRWRNRA